MSDARTEMLGRIRTALGTADLILNFVSLTHPGTVDILTTGTGGITYTTNPCS